MKDLLKLNLQLFAEDESGAEDLDFADQGEEIEDESTEDSYENDDEVADEGSAPEEEDDSSFKNEQNAAFANMRRKAEADATARANARIAAICKGHTHPVTGKPITTLDEYEDALFHQDRLRREAELREKGIDPSYIDKAIENSPLLRQAQAVIEQNNQAQAERKLQDDFEEIKKLDPSIKQFSDIQNMDVISNYVRNGMDLVSAFKVANFDTLVAQKAAGARQGAINQMKGKSHMSGVDSLASESDSIEIPEAEYRSLKEVFPNKSKAELKKLYNTTMKKLGGN